MGKKIVLVSLNQFNLPQNKLQLRDKNENASGFGSRVQATGEKADKCNYFCVEFLNFASETICVWQKECESVF